MKLRILAAATTLFWGTILAGQQGPPSDNGSGVPKWLQLGGELRGRAENAGVAGSAEAADYLQRLRLNVGVRAGSWVRFNTRFQDSRVFSWDFGAKPGGVENTFDVNLAYLEVGREESPGWSVRFGRQAVVLGAMRLVSTSNWGKVGPGWDGARVSFQGDHWKWDTLALLPVKPVSGEWDRWFDSDRKLFGVYGSNTGLLGLDIVEPYLLGFDYTGSSGNRRFATLGVRAVDTHGPVDWECAVGQRGEAAGSTIAAWGLFGGGGYRVTRQGSSPRVFAQYYFASGDANPTDGVVHTFQPMYATHKWGTADAVGWNNIHEPIAGIALNLHRRVEVMPQVRSLWLARRADVLYSVTGSVLVRNVESSSSHVGEESDVRVKWQATDRLQLLGGVGRLWAGRFLRESTESTGTNMAYLMWTFRT